MSAESSHPANAGVRAWPPAVCCMTRFEQRPTPILFGSIAILAIALFIVDSLTTLGVTDWILYLIPMVLALFLWRPQTPLIMAGVITVLMTAGFLLSPPGINPEVAKINRILGAVMIWGVAGIATQFIRVKLRLSRQEWLHRGQTGLGERIRGDQNLGSLGENVLRFLAEYLDAQSGALFVKDHDDFVRVAGYALPAGSGLPQRVAPGEGLVGEAIRSNRAFFIKDLPKEYFSIASSLGRGQPRHVLVAPATADREATGALELSFVHPVYDSDLELLNRVAESIGIALRSALDRRRMRELLEETQRQAEELQAQSEELRVSNEELAEQSRALQESQARLELQQVELEQSNQQLEKHSGLLETQKEELSRAKSGLENQARELARASRYKSEFLANMSHELRTPLNSSLILAKLLADNREGNLTPEQIKYAQTIESAGNDLLTLITDILDLSKIEAGRMEVKIKPVDLRREMEDLRRIFQPLAADKNLQFQIDFAPGAPTRLETDPQKLQQVLKNLLANAIKFTQHGEVALLISGAADGPVAFAVRDTGIGIPADQHRSIFEPFQQGEGGASRKHGGTGLGLSISRELARLLGGRIELESKVGLGSTFTVLLPAVYSALAAARAPEPPKDEARIEAARPAAARPPPAELVRATAVEDDREILTGSRRTALVIEDDAAFAGILSDIAHELSFQCLIAGSAEDGLLLARQYTPSAVLLDIGLPDNSGLSVLDRLKRDPHTRHIPVHVISASDHAETALGMGAAGYLLKPVRREQIVQAFKQLETRLEQRVRRVLVVEDDPVQLESMRRLIGSDGVEAIGARDAAECLRVLRETTVDCMILDLNLPDSSGFELLETLARDERHPFPPVIIYTGRELTPEEEQRLRRYSKSIIIKGAKSPERLLDEVTLFLHQVVSELPAEQQKLIERARHRDASLEHKRILVVEDDVRNVFALTSVLEPTGANVQVARNGREALAALERAQAGGAPPVDLVLMDIMMPEMDGLAAMREIRRRPSWKKLPIIALTAKAMKSDQEQCLAAGANDYIAKPLDVEKLLSLVRVWMPR